MHGITYLQSIYILYRIIRYYAVINVYIQNGEMWKRKNETYVKESLFSNGNCLMVWYWYDKRIINLLF
jgi:hypothetical protein